MSPETYLTFASCTILAVNNLNAFLCFLLFTSLLAIWFSPGGLAWVRFKPKSRSAIPGPSGLSLLSIFTGPTPHRVLARLANCFKAKSLMSFSIGFSRFVVSSVPETAKEILNSTAFADRPVKESAYGLLFHRAMGFAPYGEYWRNLRRISTTHLFNPKRISGFETFRREIAFKMVKQMKSLMLRNGEVEVRKVLHFGSLNNVMLTVFGQSFDFYDRTGDGFVLEVLVREGYELLGIFNWSDHFPLLGLLDLQGVRKRCNLLVSKVNAFVGNIIEEHRLKNPNGILDTNGDFVDVLLGLGKEEKLSDSDTIAVLWEMIFRGTDTVAILLEWVLARMVLHPEIQAKAQQEIDSVTDNSSRFISDSDIPKLPFLQAIVRETLRLHPPGPLLSWARLAIHDCHVGSSFVPKGTIAMVNMWAITHDAEIWEDPGVFKPERFMSRDVSVMGTDLKLAPFGSGRRVCPGKAMGLATVHLWLAQLLQSFDWVSGDEAVDLTEILKLSMEMKNPLVCKVVPRNVGCV